MYKIVFILLWATWLSAADSSVQIRHEDCLKAKYGHIIGGTLHSRKVLQKRLLTKVKGSLQRSDQEALEAIRSKYPKLDIETPKLLIRNCKVYYISNGYYFDPVTLELLKERK